jgi:hypothetical protein
MKRLIILPLLLLVPAPLAAQTTLQVTGGLNLATLSISDVQALGDDPETINGTNFGIGMTAPLFGAFGVEANAAFSQKGAETTLREPGVGSLALSMNADYIDFSLFGRFRFMLGDRAAVHFGAGPVLSFNMSCDVSVSGRIEGVNFTQSEDCDHDEIEVNVGTDFGVGGMAGFDVSLTDRLGLTAGAGYAFGLADLDETSGSARHRVLQLRAGITYSLGSM